MMINNDYKGKMTNYNEGKIYKIESHLGDMIYIGSTTLKYLCDRMAGHRYYYKKNLTDNSVKQLTSFKVFSEYGVENCKIVLIESYPCKSKDELIAREAFYIRSMDCVNKVIPDRKMDEYYTTPEYKERSCRNAMKYYSANKESILIKKKVNAECPCGSSFRVRHRNRHNDTAKHKEYESKIKLASTQIQRTMHLAVPQLDNDISEDPSNTEP